MCAGRIEEYNCISPCFANGSNTCMCDVCVPLSGNMVPHEQSIDPSILTSYLSCLSMDDKNLSQRESSQTIRHWIYHGMPWVYPVWVGNLRPGTTVNELRTFVESHIGPVVISIYINSKDGRNYAFLNLPSAEKQEMAKILLHQCVFNGNPLIVRPRRPTKEPQNAVSNTPITEPFRRFRDEILPLVIADPDTRLNIKAIVSLMEKYGIELDGLPQNMWSLECNQQPKCTRAYCSFYHNGIERELGRIVFNAKRTQKISNKIPTNLDDEMDYVNRHVLYVQGLDGRPMTQRDLKAKMEVYGKVDWVKITDHGCFVRYNRSQDAQKVVAIFQVATLELSVEFHKGDEVFDDCASKQTDSSDLPVIGYPLGGSDLTTRAPLNLSLEAFSSNSNPLSLISSSSKGSYTSTMNSTTPSSHVGSLLWMDLEPNSSLFEPWKQEIKPVSQKIRDSPQNSDINSGHLSPNPWSYALPTLHSQEELDTGVFFSF